MTRYEYMHHIDLLTTDEILIAMGQEPGWELPYGAAHRRDRMFVARAAMERERRKYEQRKLNSGSGRKG